ncbi:MAG TPA: thiol reductant ABC exporter subunit CydC [Dokdonella sp.]|uniref:thiol reductant ABC exporter subunit CydC n=1 Tax=Dokdonella sp. TaxID=2291710 RepID=UPI002CA08AAC|nr:thiol reductant ABC exporter subunit CydC [Dokdonella sp.]HUD42145.1 thiol reductant ABC exporter subunit CydC [Dokdonella sp.]
MRTPDERPVWKLALRPHAGRFALAFALGGLAVLASLGLLALSGWFITAAAVAGAGAATAAVFDIFRPGAVIRLCAIVRTAGRYGERLLSHDAVLGLLADLRLVCYRALARLAPEPLARWSEGELLQRAIADVESLDEAPLRAWLPLGWMLLVLALVLVLIGYVSPALMLAAAPWLVAAAIGVPLASSLLAARAMRELAARAGQRREALIDLMRGLTTLCLYGAFEARRDAWRALDQAVIGRRLRHRVLEACAQALIVLLVGLGGWQLLRSGDRLVAGGTVAAPWLVMAVLASLATLEAFAPVAGALLAQARSRAAQRRLGDLADARPALRFEGAVPTPARAGALQLRGVARRHPGRADGIVPFDLDLPAGTRLVVEGRSGAGKSTLLKLLARVVDPDAGRIVLDGVPLPDYREDALRASVALLPQRPHLFAMSVADNLGLGDPRIDRAHMRAALEAVALGDWLDGLPHGFDTRLGEYGTGLSGGEARRVALASVLLRGTPLVLLDEPFEGLDAETEAAVVAGVDRWVGAGTLIVVSHRPVRFGRPAARLRIEAGRVSPLRLDRT